MGPTSSQKRYGNQAHAASGHPPGSITGSKRIISRHSLHLGQKEHNDFELFKLRVVGPEDPDLQTIEPHSVGKIVDACTGKLALDASIAPSATWSRNCLLILGEGLSRVQHRDGLGLRLQLSLPISDEVHPEHCRDIRLVVPSTSELKWSSHRFQLPTISPEVSFSRIEKLELNCNLSMNDFAYLMVQGSETLRSVMVKRLIEDGSEDVTFSVFPQAFSAATATKTMVSLENLDIKSVFPFASLLNHFTMPALKKFYFEVDHGDVDFSEFTTVVWRQLDDINIHCDYEKSKLRSLQKSIYPHATFTIKRNMGDRQTT
ncbi:hypothetical protein H0H93_003007 [Arthromyces matolae]|nr:hypothetical protein H0H93_003007 [Arthromyces matolae]